MVYNNSEGVISSPNLMNSLLPKNDNYTYSITGRIGTRIHLVFSFMNLGEASFDPSKCLFIYEGYVSNRTLAATQCGDDTAQFLSKKNVLVLTYEAKGDDMLIENSGFKIYYSIGVQGTLSFDTFPAKFASISSLEEGVTDF